MNKKAQFISFLVVFLILVFCLLASAMYKNNNYLEKLKINVEASSTFKVYGLAERNKYYLEQAAEISKRKALTELEKNAGHLQGECSTDLTSGKIIWNSCPELNPNEKFRLIFEKEFTEYVENQDQPYTKNQFETTLNKDEIKNIKPKINIVNDEININFEDLSYMINYKGDPDNNSFSLKYTLNPSFVIQAPDFSVYYQLCDALVSCNLNPQITQNQIDSCLDSLKTINGVKTSLNNQIIEISYGNLNFLVNPKAILICKNPLIS